MKYVDKLKFKIVLACNYTIKNTCLCFLSPETVEHFLNRKIAGRQNVVIYTFLFEFCTIFIEIHNINYYKKKF